LSILRGIVTGLPEFSIEQQGVCRGCALGKNAKDSFPSNESRSKGILDLIHSYVSGSMSVASVQGSSYYVTFIDDFSRKTWIFFMKTKDEVFSRFQEFRAQVENQTGKKIKVLRWIMGESTPPMTSRILQGGRDQEGVDSLIQPSTKWGCREKELVHHRFFQGYDT
jgi:hypothetical protein